MDTVITPSVYQQNIYNWVENGTGNALAEAVAGSGKTSTLLGVANRLSADVAYNSIFIAFSKNIVNELQSRLPEDFVAKTIHGLGYTALGTMLGQRSLTVKNFKYNDLTRALLSYSIPDNYLQVVHEADLTTGMAALVDKCQLEMADVKNPQAVMDVIIKYDIHQLSNFLVWACDSVPLLLEKGEQILRSQVTFTDMLYFSVKNEASCHKYDFILCDESQDLSKVQREFIKLLANGKTRYLFVGDKFQAIFGFAGADCDSVEKIISEFKCTTLPLSVCYRCPKSHVKLAQALVPHIEYNEKAADGLVHHIEYEQIHSLVRSGDMVISRTVAPLVRLAFELIREGVAAKVRGMDIGKGLVLLADQIAKQPGFAFDEFIHNAVNFQNNRIMLLRQRENTEMQVQSLVDKIDSIIAVYERGSELGTVSSMGDLRMYIQSIFSDDNAAVILSSVHRAKGLEAERIFLYDPDLFPHPMARQEQQKAQEMNLYYVALTRAKSELFFVARPPKKD
jgi:hypothetical protein